MVDRAGGGIRKLLRGGKPEFVAFETETEPEGEWLAWTVKFGENKAVFAMLDIDGQIALGDID